MRKIDLKTDSLQPIALDVDEANSANEPFPAVMEAIVSDFPEPEILDKEDRNNRTVIDFSVS